MGRAWIIFTGLACAPAWCQLTLTQAVEAALARHPQLQIQREITVTARALEKQASGQFDTQVDALLQQALTHTPLTGLQQLQVDEASIEATDQSVNATTATGSATRLLRSGIQLSASAGLWRFTDNLAQTQGVNLSLIRFQANIPLLRGRGRNVVAAEETAARIEGDAALYDLNHMATSLTASAVSRYWEVIAARQTFEVWQQAEDRGHTLVNNVQTLIDADKLPRAELQQVLANLAGKTASRAAAEQRLVAAAQALALSMGLSDEELMKSFTLSDSLPDGEAATLPSMNEADVARWLHRSLERRADYLSLKQRQGAFVVRRDAASNRLKPQVDLKVVTGYMGLREGRRPDQFLVSPFSHPSGLDIIAGLSYSLPVGRHAAQGQVEQATSAARQNEFNAQEMARSITSSVLASVGAYKNAIIRVQQAKASMEASRAALDGEREKLRLGAGSVVDLVTLEDRLTFARSAFVEAGLNYAELLVTLRFATGTILEPDRMAQTVDRAIFYRPPWEDSGK